MEAVKNYLDRMFANLPNTPSVMRAKDELLQMMEDKYTELIAEGKTENEAVGSVISEFGNLDELAEALGVEEEVQKQKEEAVETKEKTILGTEEAKKYIGIKTSQALPIALGVALIILGFICPVLVSEILPDNLDMIGVAGMFAFDTAGVILIVLGMMKKKELKNVNDKESTLSVDATRYVADERDRFDSTRIVLLITGIVLCAGCWLPSAVLENYSRAENLVGAPMLFIMIAIGVFMIIYSSICKNAYDDLLDLNDKGSMKAQYKPQRSSDRSVRYISPAADFVMSVYWQTITCIYLMVSFVTFAWWASWIIWPVAAIVYVILKKKLIVRPEVITEQ
ncbi:MAG: hypothetical protein J6X33_05720 [Clostridiales bacterium]|nr:hypothetical protein [Clostridiales bacterium]